VTERFGPGALRLAGLAGQWLQWRPADFWAATPAELAATMQPAIPATSDAAMSRSELNRLMEHDHG